MNTKSLLLSKTFWVAIIQGVIGVLVVVATSAPQLGWVVILKSILDVGLRMITTQPVKV